MATFKVVISDPSTGKSEQKEVEGEAAKKLIGKKIGDTVQGDAFDLKGKTLIIRGGSDHCGFPMRADVPGTSRKRILITGGVGFSGAGRGIRKRRTVAGNTIHSKIRQVNLSIHVDKVKKAEKPAKPALKKNEGKKPAPKKAKEKPKKVAEPKKKDKK